MALLTWTKAAFGTGIGVADDQHQEIFARLNGLNETVATGDRAAVGKQLDDLIAYVAMHFKTEEDLMTANGYPDFTAHKAQHDDLVKTCLDVQNKFHQHELEITADTCVFVKDWLYDHIPRVDRHYGPFLHDKGVV